MLNYLIFSMFFAAVVQGFPWFQAVIPNGNNVPNPCFKSHRWLGVGHISESGSGARNIFGDDFFQAGEKWTVNLCEMDSDGDGKTNGQELGDPTCEWYVGRPDPGNATGHPGICEPMDLPKCVIRNKGISCPDFSIGR